MKNAISGILIATLCLLPLACSRDDGSITGTSSTTGNAFNSITGRLVDEDGNPVSGVGINIFPVNFIPQGINIPYTDTTDGYGMYKVTKPDSGAYNIVGEKEDRGVLIDSVEITGNEDSILVGDGVLRKYGAILGVTHMEGVSDINQSKMMLYLQGINRVPTRGLGGEFSFSQIPSGTYQLVLAPFLAEYDVKVLTVIVPPGQGTDLDTIFFTSNTTDTSVNTPPHAVFSVTPDSGTIGTFFSLDASASTDDQDAPDVLKVRWDWENDGAWDTGWLFSKTASCSYATSGSKTIKLEVLDTKGLTDITTRQITVESITIPEGNWSTGADIPTARYEFGTVIIGTKIYAIGGGCNPACYLATLEEYDTGTDAWTVKTSMNTPRKAVGTGVINGKIYAVGGYNGGYNWYNTMEMYDPQTDTWVDKTPMNGHGRSHAAVGVINGKLYTVGGAYHEGGPVIDMDMVEEYDPDTDTWTTKTSMPTGRSVLAVGVINGKLYAVGGYIHTPTATYLNTVEVYDPDTDTWETKAPMLLARYGPAVAVMDNKLYVAGGLGPNGTIADVEVYDPDTDVWTMASQLPLARHNLGGAAVGEKVYFISGRKAGTDSYDPSIYVHDVDIYVP